MDKYFKHPKDLIINITKHENENKENQKNQSISKEKYKNIQPSLTLYNTIQPNLNYSSRNTFFMYKYCYFRR